jgi:hypothetical protein
MENNPSGVDMSMTCKFSAVLIAMALAANVAAQGGAQPTPDNPHPYTAPPAKKDRFAEQEKTLQSQSRNSPSGSPKVDKSVTAADPVPKAFNDLEAGYQHDSRSSASGSQRVDKSATTADLMHKPATKSEKKAQFTKQEKELQQRSTQ